MNFEEFSQQYDEEWKKFPTDRVNRQIDKHKNKRDELRKISDRMMKTHGRGSEAGKLAREKAAQSEMKRHNMTAVKNHRTKMTDAHKAKQKYTGKDLQKNVTQQNKHVDNYMKTNKKNVERKNANKLTSMGRVGNTNIKNQTKYNGKSDNERQAEVNRADKEARRKAKSSLTRTNLEKLYNKESMNYSEYLDYLDQAQSPLYQVEGKLPQCPPGYVWSAKRKDCIPKTDRDKISGKLSDNKDNRPQNQYNVWGRTGLNGDGYAYEEPFVNNVGGFGESE